MRSLLKQTLNPKIIVVENGSTDGSADYLKTNFPKVKILEQSNNLGFAGGVNKGIDYALRQKFEYIALFNNDAVAKPDWLEKLVKRAQLNSRIGIVTGKLLQQTKPTSKIDSCGEEYSIWGLPFPRGRGKIDRGQYNQTESVFAASGAASLYRSGVFADIGTFDEDFFAYFEDVDLSFRARIAGWSIVYEPAAIAYHQIGATSARLGQFSRYHLLKNFYYLYIKNMPAKLFWKYLPRFIISANSLELYNLKRGLFGSLFKAYWQVTIKLPRTLIKRWNIQRHRRVTAAQIDRLLYRGVPPTQTTLLKITKWLGSKR